MRAPALWASSVHLQEAGTDVTDTGQWWNKCHSCKLNSEFVQLGAKAHHTSRVITEVAHEGKEIIVATFKAQKVITFSFSSLEKKCIFSKTRHMAKPWQSGVWGFLSKHHSLSKPKDVTECKKGIRQEKHRWVAQHLPWVSGGRAPGAPGMELGKGKDPSLSEVGHWTPAKPHEDWLILDKRAQTPPKAEGDTRRYQEKWEKPWILCKPRLE